MSAKKLNHSVKIEGVEEYLPVTSPADGQTIASVPLGSQETVNNVVQVAHQAFDSWSKKTVKDRASYLIKFHSLIQKYRDELAALIVKEHGKTFGEAVAEINKGNETVEYAFSMPLIIQGKTLMVSRGVTCADVRKPLGVVVSIVPFNFPFMVPFWTIAIAIVTGNTIVIKPSEKVPLTMDRVLGIFKEAGIPDGVVNIVHGTASSILLSLKNIAVQALCDHYLVKAVTFVGTSAVAELVHKRCRNLNKRVLALGGAKNHLIAAPDCNIDMTSSDVVASFTGCTGQRCMAASVLLLIGKQEDLIKEIVNKASKLVPGQENGQIGPVIDAASLTKIHSYISQAEQSKVEILLDGRSWDKGIGFWIGPTILLHKNKNDPALNEEIFGPVLSILVVESKEEAIQIENNNPYGNAACIYTVNGGIAEWFTERFSAGMMGVNIGVPVPREPFSFGGINKSKFGDFDITGDGSMEFFTERRKITTKWAPPQEKSWLN